ncbi:DUF2512 family protein [Cohnella candidum]|nr:DUF2512 family protein [Cohnella candidum]
MKFVLKWIVNGAIVVCLLMYYAHARFWEAAIAATLLTIIAYFIGDQFILRRMNNAAATAADAVLAIVYLWIASYVRDWNLDAGEILWIALILGIAEWLMHRYLFGVDFEVQETT